MYTIAPVAEGDAATILDIQRRAFAEEGRLSGTSEIPPLTETLDAIVAHICSQTALAAFEGTRIVGSIRGIFEADICTVRGLSVDPAYQGRGIGASLLHAIERAHPQAAHFHLTTNTVMEGNVRFYERHGYHIDSLTRYTDRITLAQMKKTVVRDDV